MVECQSKRTDAGPIAWEARPNPMPLAGFLPGLEPIFQYFTGLRRGKWPEFSWPNCAGLPNIRELVLVSIRLEPVLSGSAGIQITLK
jgi:hypothetical protein